MTVLGIWAHINTIFHQNELEIIIRKATRLIYMLAHSMYMYR